MKSLKFFIAILMVATLPLFAEEKWYEVEFPDEGIDFEFYTIRIAAIDSSAVSAFSPVSQDGGWYNGFESASGYTVFTPGTVVRGHDEGYYFEDVFMDPSNRQDYMFFAELLSESGQVMGYSGYFDYQTVMNSWVDAPNGFIPWNVGSFTAAPIPEPSSGLLLLIGGALVGLRRKRRAA